MTTPEILRSAAGYVRGGWTQRILYDGDGNVCAHGAVCCALNGHRVKTSPVLLDVEAFMDASDAIRKVIEQDVVNWNNAKGQTAENVAATMELAAICFEQAHAEPQATNAVDPGVQSIPESLRA